MNVFKAKRLPMAAAAVVAFAAAQAADISGAGAGAALKFFDWAYKNGAKMAADLEYVPLPDSLVKQVRESWKTQINGVGGV